MEVNLSPELQSKLERKAKQEGRKSEALVLAPVERLVDYDAWFVRDVEAGLAADRGEFVDDEGFLNFIESRYPG